MTRARHLFGTDGIRGTANTDPMTAEIALRLGQAAGFLFTRGSHRHHPARIKKRVAQRVGRLHE